MKNPNSNPCIITPGSSVRALKRLPRLHAKFDENYLQELLASNPDILPANAIRDDIGDLLCIGREVGVPSGSIDNLYLTTSGYPVIVETKLWRNPQARREVLSQALDYVKDIVSEDFDWFECQWKRFRASRKKEDDSLVAAVSRLCDEEIDESFYVDRVNRALAQGDVIVLIVGDGIETRLKDLVAHLCKDSSHLRYSIGLIELACYELNKAGELVVIPRIVNSIEPVQRAYVRVDVSDDLKGRVKVTPVITDVDNVASSARRVTLNEDDFFQAVDSAAGKSTANLMRNFYSEIIEDLSLEPDFKAAAIMLKIPHPDGNGLGASVMALEKQGRIYNSDFLKGQLLRWGLPESMVEEISQNYWGELNKIDSRFRVDGIGHLAPRQFLPFADLIPTLGEIKNQIRKVVELVRSEYEKMG